MAQKAGDQPTASCSHKPLFEDLLIQGNTQDSFWAGDGKSRHSVKLQQQSKISHANWSQTRVLTLSYCHSSFLIQLLHWVILKRQNESSYRRGRRITTSLLSKYEALFSACWGRSRVQHWYNTNLPPEHYCPQWQYCCCCCCMADRIPNATKLVYLNYRTCGHTGSGSNSPASTY